MFKCLEAYVEEQKKKETEGMSAEQAKKHLKKWEWSGNVPTMYKVLNFCSIDHFSFLFVELQSC